MTSIGVAFGSNKQDMSTVVLTTQSVDSYGTLCEVKLDDCFAGGLGGTVYVNDLPLHLVGTLAIGENTEVSLSNKRHFSRVHLRAPRVQLQLDYVSHEAIRRSLSV